MKKFFLLLSPGLTICFSLTLSNAYADCQGCCSWHDGVCCIDGVTMCCDGTSLSDTCVAKGCDVCPDSDYDIDYDIEYDDDGDDSGCFIGLMNDELNDVYNFEYSSTED